MNRQCRFLLPVLVLMTLCLLQSLSVAAEEGREMLQYDGEDFLVKLTFGEDAGLPEYAYLKVREIENGSDEYKKYLAQAEKMILNQKTDVTTYARFFDISIMDGDEEIEPAAAVEVSISYENGVPKNEEETLNIVHFIDDGSKEVLEVQEKKIKSNEVTEVSFEQESFSVIGMIIFDGLDTTIKSGDSRFITDVSKINVEKTWSDGNEAHADETITVTLYEAEVGIGTAVENAEPTEKNKLILSAKNNWKGTFSNLNADKNYRIKETAITSSSQDTTAIYKSTIYNPSEQKWILSEDNRLMDAADVVLAFGSGYKQILRQSSNYTDLTLKLSDITVSTNSNYGTYMTTDPATYQYWHAKWNTEKNGWELFYQEWGKYLTLTYNSITKKYEWVVTKEKSEGSYLQFNDGLISATVNGVPKYLGNLSGDGPYEAVDKDSSNIAKFRIYTKQYTEPENYVILNEKNTSAAVENPEADVVLNKTIDYLGDGGNNPDTTVDDGNTSEKILQDLYRLNLDMKVQTNVSGLDLLMVIDVSSSMRDNTDARDDSGNAITRAAALQKALNKFVPKFLSEKSKNRIAIVAFERESMILQEWTRSSSEVLEKINYEEGEKTQLYAGDGTDYEAALIRANEALASRGYSGNAQAMLFLSDGEPTVYVSGNDEVTPGNISVNLGAAKLTDAGIVFTEDTGLCTYWDLENVQLSTQTSDAIKSFRAKYPELMIGSVAFNTGVTDYLKNIASDSKFVTRIENGSPQDLINAMELITEYAPTEMVLTDELSENIELYEKQMDLKVTMVKENGTSTDLYTSDKGLTTEGKAVLNAENPVEIDGKIIRVHFLKDYMADSSYTYNLSFNANVTQDAYNRLSDVQGVYQVKGDAKTDYPGNKTSSEQSGLYSNGSKTKLEYVMNGARFSKLYRKPVVQAKEGTLVVKKTDTSGNPIAEGAEFALYRVAESGEQNTVNLSGVSGKCIQVATGITDDNGLLIFEHLRVKVFDTGYDYYLVESEAPDGYVEKSEPIHLKLYKDNVEVVNKTSDVKASQTTLSGSQKVGMITIENMKFSEFKIPVTGGFGRTPFYGVAAFAIAAGIALNRKRRKVNV